MSKQPRSQHKMLTKAIAIASEAHKNQLDKGGAAYILHPLRVMFQVQSDDPELMQIAVLHDVVEDSSWTLERLRKEGFSERVLDALTLLSRGDEDYDIYIERIAQNHDAIMVKLSDLRDNSDISRLKGIREKDFERLKKYHRSYLKLQDELKRHSETGNK